MLKKLSIHNYKCLDNFELELGPFNVFVGDNGSGKSAVLDFLRGLSSVIRDEKSLGTVFCDRTMTRWDRGSNIKLAIHAELDDSRYEFELEAKPKANANCDAVWESLSVDGRALYRIEKEHIVEPVDEDHIWNHGFGASQPGLRDFIGNAHSHPQESRFAQWLAGIHVSRFDPWRVQLKATDHAGLLRHNGENFPTWYLEESIERDEENRHFRDSLTDAISDFKSIRLRRVSEKVSDRVLDITFKKGSGEVSAEFDELSEGQRSIIYHQALLHFCATNGNLVAFDEPDNFVAINEIQPWISEVSERCYAGDAQAIIVSHSPEVLNYADPKECIYFYREEGGPSKTMRGDKVLGEDAEATLSEMMANGWINMEKVHGA